MKAQHCMYNLWFMAETKEDKEILNKFWDSLPKRIELSDQQIKIGVEEGDSYRWGKDIVKKDEAHHGVGFDGETLHFRGY